MDTPNKQVNLRSTHAWRNTELTYCILGPLNMLPLFWNWKNMTKVTGSHTWTFHFNFIILLFLTPLVSSDGLGWVETVEILAYLEWKYLKQTKMISVEIKVKFEVNVWIRVIGFTIAENVQNDFNKTSVACVPLIDKYKWLRRLYLLGQSGLNACYLT